MRRYLLVLMMLLSVPAGARQADSTGVKGVRDLEARVDSLQKMIEELRGEPGRGRRRSGRAVTGMDEILALLGAEEVEDVNMRSRSRRKRVDALLQAITDRPGVLRFNGGATSTFQHARAGGERYTSAVGSFDMYAHTAFGPRTLLFIDLEAIGGDGPDVFHESWSGLNGDAGSTQDSDGLDRLSVLEAWVEFTLLERIFTITAGKIDLTNYFDNNASANDETMQFISGAFVNSAAFAVPSNSPGLRLRTTLFERLHLQAGAASADNSGEDLLDEIYRIASLGFTTFPGSEFESNIRLYGYQHPLAADGLGWGVSFDKVFFGEYNVFGRYGWNEDETAAFHGIRSAWSAGTRFMRMVAGKAIALGFAYGENRSPVEDAEAEQVMEIYARKQMNKWAHISPHLQVVWNAGGGSERLTIFGVRTHFNF